MYETLLINIGETKLFQIKNDTRNLPTKQAENKYVLRCQNM